MEPYRFGIVGAGWRTEFFFRIAAALPERFRIEGVVTRDTEKGARLEAKWGFRTYRSLEELLATGEPEFLVGSVSYGANYVVYRRLIETGLPLLCETPPAATIEEMRDLWELAVARGARIQVGEQYHRQPHHAARLAAIRAGRIGRPHTAYVSVCHGYHGTSLIRHFLGIRFETARIVGLSWKDRVLDPNIRDGSHAEPEVKELPQQIALLEFEGGQQAVFDFVQAQYFSLIRSQRVCIRGERGEVVDHTLYTHPPGGEPLVLSFDRRVAGANGNLEGQFLKGIQLGGEWIYRNPTAPARLSDEEIATADMFRGMGEYARGGPEVYPLRDAMQDHYLGLLIREASEQGVTVTTARQPWMP